MGGYIGATAVGLVTTAADVNGDANIEGNLTVKGTTITVDSANAQTVDLGDNDKIRLGDGDDLQIYHDGSNSLITDTGTGNLTLTGSSEVTIENVARSQYMLRATDGGDVKLFHNGSEKIATTSTGIDVTGTVTADGLTVDSSSSVVATIGSSGSSAARLYFDNTGMTTAGDTQLLSQNNDLAFNTNGSEAMRIDSSGSVGIGTSSPSSYFSGATDLVLSGSGDSGLTIACSAAGRIHFADGTSGDTQYRGYIVYAHGNDSLQIATAATERMRIDSSGNVGIQTTNPAASLHVAESSSGLTARFSNQANQTLDIGTVSGVGAAGSVYIDNANSGNIQFRVGGSEKMRIDSNGDVLIGTTDANLFNETSGGETGHHFRNDGRIYNTTDSNTNIIFNRCGTDGPYIQFRKNGSSTAMGVIESRGGVATNVILRTATNQGAGIGGANSGVLPCDENGLQDNEIDLGSSGTRWDDVYATNGTIQTSDEREKQQIASLTDAEMTAAKAISKLFKTFKWNDKVEAKGDAARTHAGVIAQQVETAMSDAGLDAGKYAFFISTTWWQVDGGEAYDTQEEAPEGATERNRKGIRYPELLSFIGAATEQRLTSIESRLDALEAN